MLLGSCYAGMAFANAPVAAVHALAYPLGARFKVPHGLSNSLMLPHVLAFNAEEDEAARCYRELAPLVLPHIGQGFAATGGGDSPAAVRYLARSPAIYVVVAGPAGGGGGGGGGGAGGAPPTHPPTHPRLILALALALALGRCAISCSRSPHCRSSSACQRG
jgi:hypothetical protein